MTCVRHLAEFCIEWEILQTKVVAKITTRILCSATFIRKSCRLGDKVEKYCRAGLATDDDIIWRMHFACWVTEDTNTHSEYVILIAVLRRQCLLERASVLDCVWNVMAHAQKPDFVFRRNGRVHLNRRGRQFSRILAAELCASAVVMLDTRCSEVVWRVLATHSIRLFPLHFPSRASPCAITFQLDCIRM
jgi:hypothetical protein